MRIFKKTVELFCGTKSFSKVAEARGFSTWTTDINPDFSPDLVGDILEEKTQKQVMEEIKDASGVWMSPVCTTWSMSAGNTYWTQYRMPRNQAAIDGIKMILFCRYVADYCIKNHKWFVIENPNGRAVWILDNQYLKRVWYCRYGDFRAKLTNIWTNLNIKFEVCKRDNPDCKHERAPRGSKTGTQGLSGDTERSRIPPMLINHVIDAIERFVV
jgi:hypothetical protein